METSFFIAKLFGVFMLVVGIGLLTNKAMFQQMFDDFVKNYAVLYIGGLMSLIIGLLMTISHNIWSGMWWQVILTVFGWLSLIKGVLILILPKLSIGLSQSMKNSHAYLTFVGLLAVVLGAFLTYQGFFAVMG